MHKASYLYSHWVQWVKVVKWPEAHFGESINLACVYNVWVIGSDSAMQKEYCNQRWGENRGANIRGGHSALLIYSSHFTLTFLLLMTFFRFRNTTRITMGLSCSEVREDVGDEQEGVSVIFGKRDTCKEHFCALHRTQVFVVEARSHGRWFGSDLAC